MILEMAGDEYAALRVIAMREREAEAGGGAERGGDARNDLDRNAGGQQNIKLLAATPEDERIAALEPDDNFAGKRLVDQQLADIFLRQRMVAGHLADEDLLGRRSGKIEDAVAYIITRCKLPADADAALHKIIIPLQSAAQRLKKDPADMAAIAAMRDAVADYPRQFDDPLWSSAASD